MLTAAGRDEHESLYLGALADTRGGRVHESSTRLKIVAQIEVRRRSNTAASPYAGYVLTQMLVALFPTPGFSSAPGGLGSQVP
jgi:hypothetical protein